MRFIFLILFLLFGSFAHAGLRLTFSEEAHLERGMDQNINVQNYMNFSAEITASEIGFGVEYFQGQPETTGQQSLNLTRLRQGGWLTFSWQGEEWGFVSPYLRGGVGGFQDSVTTSLLSSSSTSISRIYSCGFGGLGLRLNMIQTFFVAAESRLIFGENQDPQPSFTALVRLGLEF